MRVANIKDILFAGGRAKNPEKQRSSRSTDGPTVGTPTGIPWDSQMEDEPVFPSKKTRGFAILAPAGRRKLVEAKVLPSFVPDD